MASLYKNISMMNNKCIFFLNLFVKRFQTYFFFPFFLLHTNMSAQRRAAFFFSKFGSSCYIFAYTSCEYDKYVKL